MFVVDPTRRGGFVADRQFGPYRLDRLLRRGGMGGVKGSPGCDRNGLTTFFRNAPPVGSTWIEAGIASARQASEAVWNVSGKRSA
jgi:hypothetical protein